MSSIGNGIYQNKDILIEPDKSYKIEFSWEGETISAQTYIPQKRVSLLSVPEIALAKIELGSFGGGAAATADPVVKSLGIIVKAIIIT